MAPRNRTDYGQCVGSTVRFTLLKITFGLTHLVCYMGKANHVLVTRRRKGIEGRRLHLHGSNALRSAGFNRPLSFAKGGIGGPARSCMHGLRQIRRYGHIRAMRSGLASANSAGAR